MSKTNLGRVSVCPMGAYDLTATYQPLDIVTYDGESFMARTVNTGVAPIDGEDWQRLVAQPKRAFEWIDTITLDEDTTRIVRTVGADGKPYNFTDMYVALETEPTDTSVNSTQAVYFADSNGVSYGGMYNDGFKINKYCKVFLHGNNGCGYVVAHKHSAVGAFNATFVACPSRVMGLNTFASPITKISITVTTSNVAMKAGGTIQIYAIRKE